MKKQVVLLQLLNFIRFISTIMLLSGFWWLGGFSFFCIPFQFAKAYTYPTFAVSFLIVYVVVLLLATICFQIKKIQVFGCWCFVLLYIMDILCFIESYFHGTNNHIFVGTIVCVAGILLSVNMIRRTDLLLKVKPKIDKT